MITVLSFYKLQRLKKLKSLKNLFFKKINHLSIKGLIILSPEGINGTLAGSTTNINIIKKIIIKNLHISKFDIQNITTSEFIILLCESSVIAANGTPVSLII